VTRDDSGATHDVELCNVAALRVAGVVAHPTRGDDRGHRERGAMAQTGESRRVDLCRDRDGEIRARIARVRVIELADRRIRDRRMARCDRFTDCGCDLCLGEEPAGLAHVDAGGRPGRRWRLGRRCVAAAAADDYRTTSTAAALRARWGASMGRLLDRTRRSPPGCCRGRLVAAVLEQPTARSVRRGAPGRTRTADAGLRTASLCPLSYGGVTGIVPHASPAPRLGLCSPAIPRVPKRSSSSA
jgi:hypothetical protein